MDILDDVLKNVCFTIIIWKDKKCIYTNRRTINVGLELKEYVNLCSILKEKYQLLNEKKEVRFAIANQNICLYHLIENICYEVKFNNHYPYDHSMLLSISNKLRGPLNNIIGILILLSDLRIDRKIKKYIGIIRESSYEIVGLANDIIDVINFSQSKVELELKQTSLKQMIEHSINITKPLIEKKRIVITYEIDEKVPMSANTDPARLQQVLVNLLKNAIYNTEIGSIVISVEIEEKYIVFRVKDTGDGVNDESKIYIDKILENRVNIKSSNVFGFGLYISKNIINLMGGQLKYISTAGMGTTFYFNMTR